MVEDEPTVREFARRVLARAGHTLLTAGTGDEALRVLCEADGFDAVFSDVVMPGMSGVELGLKIQQRYPDLPVVLTSGYSHVLAEEGTHAQLLAHGGGYADLWRRQSGGFLTE